MSDADRSAPAGYEFLEDVAIADVALRAWGASLEAVFEQAARAALEVMLDADSSLHPRVRRDVTLEEDDAQMLLFSLLQEIVFYKDAEELLLLPEDLQIEHAQRWRLQATLRGEKIDRMRHHLNADVKAVTMHRFSLSRTPHGWEATVVLDI